MVPGDDGAAGGRAGVYGGFEARILKMPVSHAGSIGWVDVFYVMPGSCMDTQVSS